MQIKLSIVVADSLVFPTEQTLIQSSSYIIPVCCLVIVCLRKLQILVDDEEESVILLIWKDDQTDGKPQITRWYWHWGFSIL